VDVVLRRSFLHVEFNHLRSGPPPQLVEPDVSQDGKKPSLHIRAGAEAIDRPYGTRACFLDKILRLDTVTTENDRIA